MTSTASIWVSATSSEPRRARAAAAVAWRAAAVSLLLPAWPAAAEQVYEAPDAFVQRVFGNDAPRASMLYPDAPLKKRMRDVLGRRYAKFRIRYWLRDGRSAWVLEEIGKERPITCGFVVSAAGIEELKVLVFRESRGWEIRYEAFTRQFAGARMTPAGKLDRGIDNITGATLSVRAATRLAQLALLLHDTVHRREGARDG